MLKKFIVGALVGPISEYLKSTGIIKMAVQGLIVIIVSINISFFYILATNFQYVVETFYTKATITHEDLIKQLKTTIKINFILENLLRDIPESSRSYIFKYHDGIKGVSSLAFLFQSNTHEVVKPGVSSEISKLQHLPINLSPERLEAFINRKCYYYIVNSSNKNIAFNQLLKQRGIIAITAYPLYNLEDKLIGYVGIDFNDMIPENIKETKKILREAAVSLAALI